MIKVICDICGREGTGLYMQMCDGLVRFKETGHVALLGGLWVSIPSDEPEKDVRWFMLFDKKTKTPYHVCGSKCRVKAEQAIEAVKAIVSTSEDTGAN